MFRSIASSTSKAYSSAFNAWAKFCAESPQGSIHPLYPTEESLCFFLAWAFHRNLSHDTTRKYLYGIRAILLGEGFTFPAYSDMPILEKVLRGWKKRSYASSRKPRLPVTVAMLVTMHPLFSNLRYERMIWAALCTGVYGLFRTGEITALHGRSSRYPLIKHLTKVSSSQYRLHLPSSKTDPFSLGVDVILSANGTVTCPIAAIDAMLADRPNARPDEALFYYDQRPLSRKLLLQSMRFYLSAAGFNPDSYSGHSLRKGGAQSLYEAGVHPTDIQTLGRWKSISFKLYISMTAVMHARFSAIMAATKLSDPNDLSL